MPCYSANLIWNDSYGRNFIQWASIPPKYILLLLMEETWSKKSPGNKKASGNKYGLRKYVYSKIFQSL